MELTRHGPVLTHFCTGGKLLATKRRPGCKRRPVCSRLPWIRWTGTGYEPEPDVRGTAAVGVHSDCGKPDWYRPWEGY